MGPDAAEGTQGGVVVGEQIEGRAGEVDRGVRPGQGQVLHPLVVDLDREPTLSRLFSASPDHVERRIYAIDIEPSSAKVKHWLAVTTPDLQGRLPVPPDEVGVRLSLEPGGLQTRVGINDDAGVEVRRFHERGSCHANLPLHGAVAVMPSERSVGGFPYGTPSDEKGLNSRSKMPDPQHEPRAGNQSRDVGGTWSRRNVRVSAVQPASSLDRRALFISGTVGAGKTSTAEAVGDWLREHEVPHAVIDLDWLRHGWPTPPGDPFNQAAELQNLRCLAGTYLDAGATRLVMAGVLEDPAARVLYEEAVGVPMTVVRLRVDLAVVRLRLAHRHRGQRETLAWHLNRCGELNEILEGVGVEDVVSDVGAADVFQVAAALIRTIGWDGPATRDSAVDC